jgi:hypothetical protein
MKEDTRDGLVLGGFVLLLLGGCTAGWMLSKQNTGAYSTTVPVTRVFQANADLSTGTVVQVTTTSTTVPATTSVPGVTTTVPRTVAAVEGTVPPVKDPLAPDVWMPRLPVKPEQVVRGNKAGCARGEGRVFCWGWRTAGNGSSSDTPTEIVVPGGADHIALGLGGTVCAISVEHGGLNQTGADDPGSLWCWGEGIGTKGYTGHDWSDEPVLLATSADWDTVAVGARRICTLTGEVDLTCYGSQPGGTWSDWGQVLATDKRMRSIEIKYEGHLEENVCVTMENGAEVCYG